MPPRPHPHRSLLPDPAAKGAELSRAAVYTKFATFYDGAGWLELTNEFDGPRWTDDSIESSVLTRTR